MRYFIFILCLLALVFQSCAGRKNATQQTETAHSESKPAVAPTAVTVVAVDTSLAITPSYVFDASMISATSLSASAYYITQGSGQYWGQYPFITYQVTASDLFVLTPSLVSAPPIVLDSVQAPAVPPSADTVPLKIISSQPAKVLTGKGPSIFLYLGAGITAALLVPFFYILAKRRRKAGKKVL